MNSRINQLSQTNEEDSRRSYVKCDCCRASHKKCLPASRTWPNERCFACRESGLPCGPPVHWRNSQLPGPKGRPLKRAQIQSRLRLSDENGRNDNNQDGGQGRSSLVSSFLVASATSTDGLGLRPQLPVSVASSTSSPQRNALSSPNATLSVESSSSTRKRKHGAAESLLNDPAEKNPFDSRQNEFVSRCIDLGFLSILYEHFEGLELASYPLLSTTYGHSITNNIKVLAKCTTHYIQTSLQEIIGRIELDGKSIERQNLRYREVLDTVREINELGPRSKLFVDFEATILNKLILIYEQQEDAPAVRRFSRRRAKLHHGSTIVPDASHIEHAAESWVETYKKLPELLDRFNLQAEAPLYTDGPLAFPAQQSALRCGDDDVAKFLCNSDGALQHLDLLKQNSVLAAAAVGKLPLLETLVQHDKSLLQIRDLFHRTLLFHTAYRGDLKTFETLVQAGADVFVRDQAGQSILGAASAAGNIDVVRWLLELGGVKNPNDHQFGPRSPLHDAARAGHKDVCSLLLQKGADASYIVDSVTPAQAARINGHDDVASMLELSEANYAGQHVSNPSVGNLPPQVLADDILPFGDCQLGSSACPTPLPLGETYMDSTVEDTFMSEFYQTALPVTPVEWAEAGTDG